MNGPEPPPWEAYNEPPPAPDPVLNAVQRGVKVGKLIVYGDADAHNSPPRDYYLKGLFSPGEMSALYGGPGCGKTFVVLYLVRAISQGRSIFGRRVHQTNCLYLALEGISGFEKRLKAEIKERQESEGFFYIAQPVDLFADPNAKEDVIEAAHQFQAGIIVIDTLNRAIGAGSENEAGDMGKFIKAVDAVRMATGAHVIVIHHSGKDPGRGMRGHSSLLGAADLVLEVTREEGVNLRIVTVQKAKDDEDGLKFGFRLTIKELGHDQDGDPITTCLVEEMDLETSEPFREKKLTAQEQRWLAAILELFADETCVVNISPVPSLSPRPCVTRDQIRDCLRSKDFIGVAEAGSSGTALTVNDRSRLRRFYESLQNKGKIDFYDEWVWLCPQAS